MQNLSKLLPTGRPRIDQLQLRGIVKRFPGVLACDGVDFEVCAGEGGSTMFLNEQDHPTVEDLIRRSLQHV